VQAVDKAIRQQILDATQRVVYSRGVSAVRMDELAQDLGMSKKTLYLYFRSKDELLDAMVDDRHTRHLAVFRAILEDESLSFIARLRSMMQTGMQASSELSAELLLDMRRHAPHLLARYERFRDEQVPYNFRNLLTEGQQLGLLRNDLRMEIVLDMFLSAITYSLTPNALRQKAYTLQEANDTFYALMFEGILNEQGRKDWHAEK
jgi:AcrR family transcriptional regulator